MDLLQLLDDFKWPLLIGLLLLAALSAWWYWSARGRFANYHNRQTANVTANSNATTSNATDLRWIVSKELKLDDVLNELRSQVPDPGGWLSFERRACDSLVSERATWQMRAEGKEIVRSELPIYDQKYLVAAGDADRAPLARWVWVLWLGMVIAESYAFNLLLADYVTLGGTPKQQQLAAYALSFMFSVVFVGLAHIAGRSFFHQKRAYDVFLANNSSRIDTGAIGRFSYPNDPDDSDAPMPAHLREARRFSTPIEKRLVQPQIRRPAADRGFLLIVAMMIVAMTAIFAFRVYDLYSKENEESRVVQQIESEKGASSSGPDAPKGLVEANNEAEKAADAGTARDKRTAFFIAFGIFSLLFLGVQATGILISVNFGFASGGGEKAYQMVRNARFSTLDEYMSFYRRLFSRFDAAAQAVLADWRLLVQSERMKRGLNYDQRVVDALNNYQTRTFARYLAERSRESEAVRAGTASANSNPSAAIAAPENTGAANAQVDPAKEDLSRANVWYFLTPEDPAKPPEPPKTLIWGELLAKIADEELDKKRIWLKRRESDQWLSYAEFRASMSRQG